MRLNLVHLTVSVVLSCLVGGAQAGTERLDELSRERAARVLLRASSGPERFAESFELGPSVRDRAEIRAPIEAIDPSGERLTVLGRTVHITSSTRIGREVRAAPRSSSARLIGASPSDLVAGVPVRVVVRLPAAAELTADAIHLLPDGAGAERVLIGPYEVVERAARDFARVRLLGFEVLVDGATRWKGLRPPPRPIVRPRLGFVDEDDLRFGAARRRSRRVAFAGELRVRAESTADADLDAGVDDERVEAGLFGVLGIAADLGPVFAYLEALGRQSYPVSEPRALDNGEGDARIGEAYFEITGLPRLSVAVGRQKFNESREWYYNRDTLDAVRLLLDLHPLTIEASVSQNVFDQRRHRADRERRNVIVHGELRLHEALALETYYIDRRDRTGAGDSPRLLGLRLSGSPGRRLEYWADLAGQRGTRPFTDETTGAVVVRGVRAAAYDVGLTFRPRVVWDPSLTLAWAVGSGEADPVLDADPAIREQQLAALASAPDRGFTQSGLHRNRAKFNGVVSFAYYGEALDPELSNLRVSTLGLGIRPTRRVSLDLVHHRYRQDEPSARLRDSELDVDPSGVDVDLGRAWDLILGYEPTARVELRVSAGRFSPGPAFVEPASAARPAPLEVVGAQAKFRF